MKRLGISMFALFVGVPMMANAAVQSPSDVTLDSPAHVAGTSYVQGAYNAMAAVARDHATQIDANTSAIAGKQAQLQNNAETPVDINASVLTSVRADGTADDTHIVTEKAVRDAVKAVATSSLTADGTATLTNKTIDADDNTISDLETDNFKSGVVQTTVRATSSASDTALASEKAVATALSDKQDKSDSEVTSAEATAHSVLSAGTAVHTNLVNLATAIEGKQDAIDASHKIDSDNVDDTNQTNKFVTAAEKSQITTNQNAIGTLSNLTTSEQGSLVGAINEVKGNVDTLGAKQVSVYTTWGQTTTAKVAALVNPDPVTP